ncbi:3-oxoacyl-ACP synthase [bacterium SCSIO 12741]|nr:3-oxoacyl-ACP synthase [bacterium SCSIO 12741]
MAYESVNSFDNWVKAWYRSREVGYGKFFKMDRLSKLGFMAAELVLEGKNLSEKYGPERVAVLLGNRAASLDTDRKHHESIKNRENYFPSPAVFVYTLPNIVLGEIAIRHTFRGENAFFIFDKFEPGFFVDLAQGLLASNKADAVLFGWVDVDGESYEAELYLAEQEGGEWGPLSEENISNLKTRNNG